MSNWVLRDGSGQQFYWRCNYCRLVDPPSGHECEQMTGNPIETPKITVTVDPSKYRCFSVIVSTGTPGYHQKPDAPARDAGEHISE